MTIQTFFSCSITPEQYAEICPKGFCSITLPFCWINLLGVLGITIILGLLILIINKRKEKEGVGA